MFKFPIALCMHIFFFLFLLSSKRMLFSQTFYDLWDRITWFYDQKIHFLQLHYFYIFFLAIITSTFFYFQPNTHWNYIDALFMATSTVTNTGLNTINMSLLSTWQLVVMYLSSFAGSHIMVSIIVLYVRRHYFSKRFEDILLFNKAQRKREANRRRFEKSISELDKQHRKSLSTDHKKRRLSTPSQQIKNRLSFSFNHGKKSTTSNSFDMQLDTQTVNESPSNDLDDSISPLDTTHCHSTMSLPIPSEGSTSMQEKKAKSDNHLALHKSKTVHLSIDLSQHSSDNTATSHSQAIAFSEDIEMQRKIARQRFEQERQNEEALQRIALGAEYVPSSTDFSTLLDASEEDEEIKRIMREPIHKSELTRQQRYRLGGAEYRAIDFLTMLVPIYYLFFIVAFGFFIRIYIAASTYAQHVLSTSNSAPVDTWLFAFFTSLSSFNNLGLVPLDANLVPFQSAPCLLILSMILILAGNTAYAINLRLIIWVLYKLTPETYKIQRETYQYLLDHPRRCYTTLFPSTQTKWLLIVLLCITAIEFTSFVALNFWLPVLEGIDWGARILDGLFQSVATRNGKVIAQPKYVPKTNSSFLLKPDLLSWTL